MEIGKMKREEKVIKRKKKLWGSFCVRRRKRKTKTKKKGGREKELGRDFGEREK
jgi:hypothetical protein